MFMLNYVLYRLLSSFMFNSGVVKGNSIKNIVKLIIPCKISLIVKVLFRRY